MLQYKRFVIYIKRIRMDLDLYNLLVIYILHYVVCMQKTTVCGQHIHTPCADIQPHYLLQHLVPSLGQIPAGIQIQYDQDSNLHAFSFTSHASGLGFPAKTVFKHCDYFAEELSLLISFKTKANLLQKEETLLAVIPRTSNVIKFGVTLVNTTMRIYYWDGLIDKIRFVEFEDISLFDLEWHSVIVVYKRDRITVTVDCGFIHMKRISRTFPSLLNISEDRFFIGNSNDGRKALFSGLLQQLVLLPGSDITKLACTEEYENGMPPLNMATVLRTATQRPRRQTERPREREGGGTGNNVRPVRIPNIPEVYDPLASFNQVCQFGNTGELWFDLTDKTLKVCYSGVWQPILLPPDKRHEKKLDYFVWYQDLVTSAPTIDIEIFTIPGHGLFLAAASYDSTLLRKTQSAIFRWNTYRFQLYQTLYTFGAQSWTFFEAHGQFYLAVANTGGNRERAYQSIIYKWSSKRKRFRPHQEIETYTARDLEYFMIDGVHYIVVANHVIGENHTVNSVLYRMDPSTRKFDPIQNITTTGAYDWTHVKVDGYHFLVVANSFTLHPYSTTHLNSTVYFWQSGIFIPFQTIPTVGATDFEFFTLDGNFFIVVANAFDYSPDGTQSHSTVSVIYMLNKFYKRFEEYQRIATHSAVDWESFSIDNENYLLVSNAQNDDDVPENVMDPSHKRSTLFRWQGVDRFVPVHYLVTRPSADWETFELNGELFIVYANAKENISQVFKAKLK